MSDKPSDRLLNPDVISQIMEKREQQKRVDAILAEERADYIKVVNRLFSTRDGQYFLKKMIRYSGLFSFDNKFDATIFEDKGKKKFLTELILPYLDKTIFAKAISE